MRKMPRHRLCEHNLNSDSVEAKYKTSAHWLTGSMGDVCTTCKIIFGPPGPPGEPGEPGEEGLMGKDTK